MTMSMKWMPVPMLRLKKVDLADGKIMRRDITVTREAWLWDGSETCYRCKRPIMPDDLVLVMDCGATTPRKLHRMCLVTDKTIALLKTSAERELHSKGCDESAATEDLLHWWEREANG